MDNHLNMSKNHGTAKAKMNKGGSIKNSYGRDNSDITGSSGQERIGPCGGGTKNLAHSLKGTTATQRNP